MINSNELRIGNLILLHNPKHRPNESGKICTIIKLLDDYAELRVLDYVFDDFGQFYKFLDPIRLTEEWLLKFGFKQGGYNGLFWSKLNLEIAGADYLNMGTDEDGFHFIWYDGTMQPHGVNIQSIHQLQNLWFTLTKSELILEETI